MDTSTIVTLVPNLMFATRIEDLARKNNAAVLSPPDRASYLNALLNGARLVLIDANSLDPAWLDWVAAAKDNPASELVPVIAFGSHTIFIGEVMSIRMRDGEVDPLIYLNGQYRQLATPAA